MQLLSLRGGILFFINIPNMLFPSVRSDSIPSRYTTIRASAAGRGNSGIFKAQPCEYAPARGRVVCLGIAVRVYSGQSPRSQAPPCEKTPASSRRSRAHLQGAAVRVRSGQGESCLSRDRRASLLRPISPIPSVELQTIMRRGHSSGQGESFDFSSGASEIRTWKLSGINIPSMVRINFPAMLSEHSRYVNNLTHA